MNKVLPLLLLALLGPLLANCAPTNRWEKPGTDLATTQKDQAQCRKTAELAAQRTFSRPTPGPWAGSETWTPYTGMRADSGNMWQTSAFQGEDRVAAESRITVWCMRKLGYDKIAIPPPPATAASPPSE